MSVVFINNSIETFTASKSGALATIIYECCRVAARENAQPLVLTRSTTDADPFPWPAIEYLEHPPEPTSRAGIFLGRAERKLLGYRNIGQRQWCSRVVDRVRKLDLAKRPLVLLNEPELAVILRREFPKARVVHWFQNQQPSKPRFHKLFASHADVILGVSDFTSRWIEQHYGLSNGSVKTLYNATDTDAFHPAESSPNGPVVVNFVGRTGIEKAPDLFLEAALALAKRPNTAPFTLQVLGSNHWNRFELDGFQLKLNSLVEQLEQAGVSVRRPGHISRTQLPHELRKAHIHVTPSRWDEPFGMTTVEAMASGLATIASRTGGTPEIVQDHGLLFARDSAPELADALAQFVNDRKTREFYALRARERATCFTWSRVWEGLKHAALN